MCPCFILPVTRLSGCQFACTCFLSYRFYRRSAWSSRFHNILDDDDIDRVWGCVEDAIEQMAEEEEDEEEDDDTDGEWI